MDNRELKNYIIERKKEIQEYLDTLKSISARSKYKLLLEELDNILSYLE